MDKKTLMERLRNPQKFRQQVDQQAAPQTKQEAQAQQVRGRKHHMTTFVWGGVLGLLCVSLAFIFSAQKKAENIPAFLDKSVLQGLIVDKTFTPNAGRRYVQINEGADRSVTAVELGSTLPVISRYNFRAFTNKNYEVIGAAPWAILINVGANIEDPEILLYLFNQDAMKDGFFKRENVAAVLKDPAELAKLAADENRLREFFREEPVQQVLASQKALDAIAGSRFMAYLLISKSAKYYREHPEEAAKLINASPTLSALKKNEFVRQAVTDNAYLKNIAPTLLK